ncbi:nuclear VCP like [Homo sapiens]|uniref:Nuclear valosin-containing protein-like n=1 Tax=Homo sapiens TaxID=9606 RepID=NVL_HUMAN|nr:nuclear valosin-containing protein-like isoform 1 [Homo sapiens]O15381.1 RecName: Full=Nuclear valosin-containing protein-like; Short=NVLp; Short=Nuclear VCP-like protein [Homo sapiens]AAB70457.1 nuclear VCP-like protein NVLp.2 [Homo sapiens]EAW69714.1 nuclear VCP-like, isoform CRA_a [Homo sapiens]KAI2521557.1 nuclear VCP like [Homo sapiens]KAI4085078.1 nuclear VCP like [Homo sapiens]|eukprot:NP_002524.2 nuclear valosin-containing protein-like isoform 1 [Homo sapiens]
MKPRPAGFVDNKLKQRVIQYLTSNKCGKYVDIGVLASDLQRVYSIDYGRRKRNAFRIQVEKVFSIISSEKELKNLTELEDEHLAKRARQGEEDNEYTESYSDDDSSMEDYPDPQSANHMNSSLLSLYRKGNPDSVSNTPEMEQRETTSSTPRISSKTGSIPLKTPAKDSEGGWFIDKTPSVKKDSFFLDLSCEKSNPKKPITEIQDSKDSSLLESDMKRKGKLKNKGSKRKKEDLQEVDGEIEAVLQKKAKARGLEFQISNVKFEDVGGNDMTLKEVCKMLIHMRHPEVYHHLGVVPPRGVLLHGPPGCGKTLLAHAIAGELDLPILKVAAPEIVSGVSGESEQKLRELFEQAVSNAPCIIFIDEIDAITPKREVASKDMERRIVAQLLTCMDDLNNVAATARVLVIGATNRPDSLDPALRRAGRFDREICLGIPDEASRERILQTLCRKLRLPQAFDFCHLAHLTPGFVGADLMALCREAAMCAVNRVLMKLQEQQKKNPEMEDLPSKGVQEERLGTEPTSETQDELQRLLGLLRDQDPLSEEQMQGLCIELNDFIVALSSVQPSAKREGFVTVPNVTWADIGALEDIREELTMAILAPVRNPDQFKALGLVTPAGVLLAGPPGCGKTLLAKAVANESGLNFISVKGPELLNMYVGESERAVRQVFQRAKNSAPCVIFFDEVDALCPRRSDRETGASVRVVNQLLTEMDGLEARQQVFIMAATNRPDIIDPAILRPGRLDKTLFVGLPPPADRLAILKTITKNGTKPPLDADVNLEAIAGDLRCDCYTGADLSALVREASICALRQEMARQKSGNEKGELKVSHKHFEEAFKKVRSSISKKDQIMYERLQESLSR